MNSKTLTRLGTIYMQLRDRKKLATLMAIQDVSQRQLAVAAGWGPNSHSFMSRLVKGEATAVSAESAVRIAHHLDVPVDTLFLTKLDSKDGQSKPKPKTRMQVSTQ